MAGFSLFGGYQKPGPGVSKNAPQKPPVSHFFELLFRKFFELVKLNLLFLIPVIAVSALVYLISRFTSQAFFINLPVVLLTPFCAGLTLITRNYAREEHAFLVSDFKDSLLANWKQFAINGMVCYVLGNIIVFCIQFYYTLAASQNFFYMIPFGISVAILFVFLFIQYYVPVMIVTFDLNLKQIYKNGFIFAIVGLWRNILLTLILGGVLFLNHFLYYIWPLPILLMNGIWLAFLAFSVTAFLINFTVYPLIEKLMIKPVLEHSEESSDKGERAEILPDTSSAEAPAEEQQSEYVFYNGKLVKRSLLNNESIFEDKE